GDSEQAVEIYEHIIKSYPNSLWANVAIIHKAYMSGDLSTGLQAVDSLVNTSITDGETIFYTAAYYGLLGDQKRSLELLRKAVEAGYFNHINIATNDYLDPIKSTQEYQLILALAERKHMAFIEKFFPEG
ncbi:MAG: tetratricopeptide repeat protein, partial [Marinicella sp.]